LKKFYRKKEKRRGTRDLVSKGKKIVSEKSEKSKKSKKVKKKVKKSKKKCKKM
jgi:hypothetical protein